MSVKEFMTSSVGRSIGEWLAEWVTIGDSIVYIVTFGKLKPHNAFRIMAAINRLSISDRVATLIKQRAARQKQWTAEGEAEISNHDDLPLKDVRHQLLEADLILNRLVHDKNLTKDVKEGFEAGGEKDRI